MISKITSIKTGDTDYIMNDFFASYIFCTIFNFLEKKRKLEDNLQSITIEESLLEELSIDLTKTLYDLLNISYEEPNPNDVQKHSSRYEKIVFMNKTYRLNYRISICDKLSYAIYLLIDFVKKAKEANEPLVFDFS